MHGLIRILYNMTHLLAIAGQTTVYVLSPERMSGSRVMSVVRVTEKRKFTGV